MALRNQLAIFAIVSFLISGIDPSISHAQSSINEAIALQKAQANRKTIGSSKQSSTKTDEETFADQFWNYLLSNNYKHWSPPAGQHSGFFRSKSKLLNHVNRAGHSELLKIYVNRVAASNPADPPVGSVLVLENFDKGKSLKSISVMYRTQGFNPKGNDWYWVEYAPDGSVMRDTKPAFDAIDKDGSPITFTSKRVNALRPKLMGRANSCIACHRHSNSDLAFYNDATTTPKRMASIPKSGRSNK